MATSPNPIATDAWLQRYAQNSFTINPSTSISKSNDALITQSPASLQQPTPPGSLLSLPATSRFPYALQFNRVVSLPIPPSITDDYLDENDDDDGNDNNRGDKPLILQLRISLYNVETASFLGRTWIDPVEYNLRAPSGDAGSVRWNKPGENFRVGPSKPARRRKSSEERIKDRKRKSGKRRSRSNRSDSGSDDSFDDGSEDNSSRSGNEGSSVSEDEEYYSDQEESDDQLDVGILGHRVAINLGGHPVYIHTSLTSRRIIAVIEFVMKVRFGDQKRSGVSGRTLAEKSVFSEISAGWTFFPLFDPELNGIDLEAEWQDEEALLEWLPTEENQKIFPIYYGTPRILLFISPLLMESLLGYPVLTEIPGSQISVHWVARPDLRPMSHLWRENVWIGQGDDVPGIRFMNDGDIEIDPTGTAIISKISVSLYPSILNFEETLLAEVALSHFKAFPDSMFPDEDGNLPLPEITERRIHIGLHNTQTFLTQPISTTLLPVFSEDMGGDGFTLAFNGNLELDKYMLNETGIGLLFTVEYKVLLKTLRGSVKKTGLSAVIERMSGSPDKKAANAMVGIEKLVPVAWFVWTPNIFNGQNPQTITAVTGSAVVNPYAAQIVTPSVSNFADEEFEFFARMLGRRSTESAPVVISFNFYDDQFPMPQSDKASPSRGMVGEPSRKREKSQPSERSLPSPKSSPRQAIKQSHIDEDEESEDMIPVADHKATQQEFTTLPMPKSRKSSAYLNRGERSRLLSAGFQSIGEVKKLCSPLRIVNGYEMHSEAKFDLKPERIDDLKSNEFTLTLMGMSFNSDSAQYFSGQFPSSVYFSFQFYTFPYVSTERVYLYRGEVPLPGADRKRGGGGDSKHQRSSSMPTHHKHSRTWSHFSQRSMQFNNSAAAEDTVEPQWPAIFYAIEDDGSILYSSPGLSRSFTVDHDDDIMPSMAAHRARISPFIHYLCHNNLQIDIWDGDSLLFLGSASIDLRHCLRQGNTGVLFEDDVEIIVNEDLETSISGSASTDFSSTQPITSSASRILSLGKLHIRALCAGKRDDPRQATVPNPNKVPNPFDRASIVVRDFRFSTHPEREVVVSPRKMVDIEPELVTVLSSAYEERLRQREGSGRDNSKAAAQQRKIQLLKRAIATEERKGGLDPRDKENRPFSYQISRQERQRDLQTIDAYRERKRPGMIENVLIGYITTRHRIYASFGQGHFFEFLFMNPYNTEHNFEIDWDDEELRLVTDPSEWKYLRRVFGIRSSIEDKLINVRAKGPPQLFLSANEVVSIPFVFQSFHGGRVTVDNSPDSEILRARGNRVFEFGGGISARTITVSFCNSKKIPVSILDLMIIPSGYTVDQTIRFFRSEGELMRRAVKIGSISVHGHGHNDDLHRGMDAGELITTFDTSSPDSKYMRCNDEEVLCTLANERRISNAKEITFKLRVGPAPESQVIHLLFYDDPFHNSLVGIWRVFIHSLHRLDVNCIFGQSNPASMIIRGSTFTRTIQCHSNRPDELLVTSPGTTMLTPNVLTEINLMLRPRDAVVKDMILNIVDVDRKVLVSSWLVVSHCSPPNITKSFQISLPRGKIVNKRVSYTNPYPVRKTFHLKTNAEGLIQFHDGGVLHLDGLATQYISMRIMPVEPVPRGDVLIFLNDEHDKIEECLKIQIMN